MSRGQVITGAVAIVAFTAIGLFAVGRTEIVPALIAGTISLCAQVIAGAWLVRRGPLPGYGALAALALLCNIAAGVLVGAGWWAFPGGAFGLLIQTVVLGWWMK